MSETIHEFKADTSPDSVAKLRVMRNRPNTEGDGEVFLEIRDGAASAFAAWSKQEAFRIAKTIAETAGVMTTIGGRHVLTDPGPKLTPEEVRKNRISQEIFGYLHKSLNGPEKVAVNRIYELESKVSA